MKKSLKNLLSLGASFLISGMMSLPVLAEDGVTNSTITLGSATAMTGKTSGLGTNFIYGFQTYIKKLNDSGGINGRKVELIIKDDGYEPVRTVKHVNDFFNSKKVFCLVGHMGSPTTKAIKDILLKDKFPLFGTFSGAEVLRHPVNRYLFHYRASYWQEMEDAMIGMVDVLKYKKIGVFYQDDAYGGACFDGVKVALKKRGLIVSSSSTYKRNSTDVEAGLKTIMADKPEVVMLGATYQAASKFILEARARGYNPVFVCNSGVGTGDLLKLLGRNGDNVIVTQIVPLTTSTLPAVINYLTAYKPMFPDIPANSVSLEGFLTAQVFFEGVKRAGKDLTREKLVQAIEGIKGLDIRAGNEISYSGTEHQGSQKVYNTIIRGGNYFALPKWEVLKK